MAHIGQPKRFVSDVPEPIEAPTFVPSRKKEVDVPDWLDPNKVTVPERELVPVKRN
jgi:hypothetical protein